MPRQKPVVPRIDTSLAQLNAAEPAVLTSTAIAHAAALPTPALPRDTLLPPVPRLDSSTTSAPTSAQIAPPNTADPDVSHQLHPRFDKRLHSASSPLLDINTFLDLLPTPDEERSMSYRRPLRHSPRLHLAPSPFSPRPLFDTLLSRSLRSHVSLTAGPTHVATDVPSEPLETPLLEKTDHEWPLPMGHAPPAPKPVVENTTLPTPPTSIEASRAASPTLTVQPVPLTPYLSMPEEKKPKKGELLKCTVEGCGQVFKRPHNLKSHLRIHTDARPFVCPICNKAFLRVHDQERHMLIHAGSKQHVCVNCNSCFTRPDALTRHLRLASKHGCRTSDRKRVPMRPNEQIEKFRQQHGLQADAEESNAR